MNAQLGRMLGFDLIVLQWGLNAMSTDATDFKAYGAQLRRVVNYMKSCFPRSAIVIMGVGDRAVQRDGEMVTQPGLESMLREQRAAAAACGVAFWDTFSAMGGRGSMAAFVERGWAAKDYTHLSYGGGRYIAGQFVRSLLGARGAAKSEAPAEGVPEPESVALDLSHATQPEQTKELPVRDTVAVEEAETEVVSEEVVGDTVVHERSVWESLEAAVDSTRM
jgi:hypothetical protein